MKFKLIRLFLYYHIIYNRMIIYHYKEIGQTMNQVVDDIKQKYNTTKVTYAGRLDPLAFGLVIILTDEDVHKRDEYIGKNKIYQFNIIYGIQTDTYDIMGMLIDDSLVNDKNSFDINKLNLGKQIMKYPPYSSVPIKEHNNKPYWYCSLNHLEVKNKPTKEIEIYGIKILDKTTKTKDELIKMINDKINKVTSETFRQKDILKKWDTIEDNIYDIYKMEIKISSGGYVRNIADKLGGCAFDIERMEYC
jgi:tRNA pseudouridine(55) synthase